MAIEDAMYMGALSETSSRNSFRGWGWPTQEEMIHFITERVATQSSLLEPAVVCENPLGLYLVNDMILTLYY